MRQFRAIQTLVVVLLLSSVFFIPAGQGQTTFDGQVEATITCTFETGAILSVRAQMIVNRIDDIYDTSYDRQTIESISLTDLEVMGIIKQRLRDSVRTQIETAFPGTAISTNTRPTYVKPYFIDEFRVNLTESFFQYNGSMNLTKFINGVLDMGATVTYQFDLQAEVGWNTTYVYVLSEIMTLAYANTDETTPETNSVSWAVQNWDGSDSGMDAVLSVKSKNPTTASSETEDISFEFTIDTRTVSDFSFIDAVVVKKINLGAYHVLPEFITGLGSIPADGIRLFIDSGLFSWEDVFEKTIQPIEEQTTPVLENSSLNQPLSFSFSWDAKSTTNCSTPFNITQMDDDPAIRANFHDPDVSLLVCLMPAKAFFGLINAGATASISSVDMNFGLGLDALPLPYASILLLPANITLSGTNVYSWNKTTPLAGEFLSDLQPTPPYADEHIETFVEIDISKMDLNIPSVFTGKTQLTSSTKMKVDESLYIIRKPDDFLFSSKVNISFLNADAVRLCIEESVVDESQISSFLSKRTEAFQQRLSAIFHGLSVKGIIDRKIFSNSLAWDGDISAMDGVVPVVVSNAANEVYTIGFNVSLWPASLSIAPQQFILQGIEHQAVTYRIIFPRGITVNTSDSAGKAIIAGNTNDGRQYVDVSFDAAAGNQSTILMCVLNASPVYVLGLFLPCILVFILLVVLVVIILLIRKKKGGLRRGKGKLFEPEDNEPVEYSGQEYYVPPPPSSTKKKK